MNIRHKVVAYQPKVKRDKTGSIVLGTLLELTKEQFDDLNDAYYNGEELHLILATDDQILDALREAGDELLNN